MAQVEGLAFRVTGRVQGVGFRYFTLNCARRFTIHGWVQNEADGSVTGFAVGAAPALQQFCDQLTVGPEYSRVDQVHTQRGQAPDPEGVFTIRR